MKPGSATFMGRRSRDDNIGYKAQRVINFRRIINSMEPLEILWDALLSREPEEIRAAYIALDEPSRLEVVTHLREMIGGEGWQPEQVTSARAALEALQDLL